MEEETAFTPARSVVAGQRLVGRHVRAGIAGDEEEAGRRADENGLVNGREIVEKRLEVQEVVRSVEDGAWAPWGDERSVEGDM